MPKDVFVDTSIEAYDESFSLNVMYGTNVSDCEMPRRLNRCLAPVARELNCREEISAFLKWHIRRGQHMECSTVLHRGPCHDFVEYCVVECGFTLI